MYCPKCSTENPDAARFCRKCGFQMRESQKSDVAKTKAPMGLRILTVVGGGLLTGLGIYLFGAGLTFGEGAPIVLGAIFMGGGAYLVWKTKL